MASKEGAPGAGIGSVWNVGNWHWEAKNFNSIALQIIRARLTSIAVSDGRFELKVVEVPSLKADASIHIRKGKKIPSFDITLEAKWEGRTAGGDPTKITHGVLRVRDLLYDDVDDDFPVVAGITAVSTGNAASSGGAAVGSLQDVKTRDLARGAATDAVRRHLREFAAQLAAAGGSAEEVAADAARREEEQQKTQKAIAEKAEEKERLFKEQQEVDRAKRAAVAAAEAAAAAEGGSALASTAAALSATSISDGDSRSAASASTAAPATTATAAVNSSSSSGGGAGAGSRAAAEAAASSWNVGAWNWESREFTPWAKARMNELVAGFEIDCLGGHIKIVEVTSVKGDASSIVRKGKKFVIFELHITAKWEGELVNSEGVQLGTGDGEVDILDLDQDSGLGPEDGSVGSGKERADYRLKVRAADDGGRNDAALASMMERWGCPVLRRMVRQFVQELKDK